MEADSGNHSQRVIESDLVVKESKKEKIFEQKKKKRGEKEVSKFQDQISTLNIQFTEQSYCNRAHFLMN